MWLPIVRPLLGTWPTTQACALGWDSNWQPFDLQAGSQSAEPYLPGHNFLFAFIVCSIVAVSFMPHMWLLTFSAFFHNSKV